MKIAVAIVAVAVLAGGGFYVGFGRDANAQSGTNDPTTTSPAPPPRDTLFEEVIALRMHNLSNTKDMALGLGLCIPEQALPVAIPSTASQTEKLQYLKSLEDIERFYWEGIKSGINHCHVAGAAPTRGGGSTGYGGPTGGTLPDYVDWGGYPVPSPGPEAGAPTPTPSPVPDTPPTPTPAPPVPAPPVPTPVPDP